MGIIRSMFQKGVTIKFFQEKLFLVKDYQASKRWVKRTFWTHWSPGDCVREIFSTDIFYIRYESTFHIIKYKHIKVKYYHWSSISRFDILQGIYTGYQKLIDVSKIGAWDDVEKKQPLEHHI